jgi:hypothetical protein
MISAADFNGLVESSFGETLTAHGFHVDQEWPYRIRYRRGDVFVDADYDASRSRELTVWVGRDDEDDEPPLALPDVLRATTCDLESIDRAARTQTGDPAFLAELLAEAGDLLARFGQPFLQGARPAFLAARRLRSERARAYTAELRTRGALEAADAAWNGKDYDKVRELLDPIRESLDESHLRRLVFAEKQRK